MICFDVAVLVVWKYAGFLTEQLAGFARLFGGDFPVTHLLLPIGISFYTFHNISYVVDIYRGERPALRNPVAYATYISMFPQLIAGPIVGIARSPTSCRRSARTAWTTSRRASRGSRWACARRSSSRTRCRPLVDACFATPGDEMTFAIAWLGALAYTLQLYFDFSGYSDMAIGLGRMLGFRLPENFARPYSSVTITEFWRRWHMSLSRWFRDYVYIPLGGNRHGAARTYRNLCIVFVLTGFWHGANWTFLVWGLYHGALLIIERGFGVDGPPARGRRCPPGADVPAGGVRLGAVPVAGPGPGADDDRPHAAAGLHGPDRRRRGGLHQPAAGHPAVRPGDRLPAGPPGHRPAAGVLPDPRGTVLRVGVMTVGLFYAAVLAAAGTFSPFLYYQF